MTANKLSAILQENLDHFVGQMIDANTMLQLNNSIEQIMWAYCEDYRDKGQIRFKMNKGLDTLIPANFYTALCFYTAQNDLPFPWEYNPECNTCTLNNGDILYWNPTYEETHLILSDKSTIDSKSICGT